MSIKKAYCLQMNKLTTSSQARVSFLSSENTLYERFSFYCVSCGTRLTGANVHKREELTSSNKTSHFKKYSKDINIQHISTECKRFNNSSHASSIGRRDRKDNNGKLIVYDKFKLSQINYEIVNGLNNDDPDSLSTEITLAALESEIECDIHTTSILKDLVNCFNNIKEREELKNYPLDIEGNSMTNNNYATVFRDIVTLNFKSEKVDKLNERNNNFFRFRVLYGKSQNKAIKKEEIGWSFLIDFTNEYDNEKYFYRETIDEIIKVRPMIVRVFIPTEILNKFSKLSNQYTIDEKDKILDSFYLINCIPSVEQWNNNNRLSRHEELLFKVNNLNHIHLTFKNLE